MKMIRLLDSGKADFDTILVYDYSRWGRFTNCKEAYYWEFICNKHGVRVVFTDESVDQFPLPANIGKSLRESMRGRRRDSADDSRVRRGQ
jgi:DNA invertase Pin-like site-specific DNA recombinase